MIKPLPCPSCGETGTYSVYAGGMTRGVITYDSVTGETTEEVHRSDWETDGGWECDNCGVVLECHPEELWEEVNE